MVQIRIMYRIEDGPVVDEVCDAVYVEKDGTPGYKVFHNTCWWWVPQEYVELVKEEEG